MDDEDRLNKQISTARNYKIAFGSPEGQSVLEHLKQVCSYSVSTIDSGEARDMSVWREGRRSVVLDIINFIELNLESFKKRQREEEARRKKWETS